MAESFEQSMQAMVAQIGLYPEQAYHFVRDGLSYAVQQIHGPESPAQRAIMRYLAKHRMDLTDLVEQFHRGDLSPALREAIDSAGGIDHLNRHITGREMCWGLRDYALHRWGVLAVTILDRWNVRATIDFGRLVFAMIEFEFMQKQPSDSLEDFREVYEFAEAFEQTYRIDLGQQPSA